MLIQMASDVHKVNMPVVFVMSQEASNTPVFGSASTFGADKGFGGFSAASGATPATNADMTADNDQAGMSAVTLR